jgi:hypothetical protein
MEREIETNQGRGYTRNVKGNLFLLQLLHKPLGVTQDIQKQEVIDVSINDTGNCSSPLVPPDIHSVVNRPDPSETIKLPLQKLLKHSA